MLHCELLSCLLLRASTRTPWSYMLLCAPTKATFPSAPTCFYTDSLILYALICSHESYLPSAPYVLLHALPARIYALTRSHASSLPVCSYMRPHALPAPKCSHASSLPVCSYTPCLWPPFAFWDPGTLSLPCLSPSPYAATCSHIRSLPLYAPARAPFTSAPMCSHIQPPTPTCSLASSLPVCPYMPARAPCSHMLPRKLPYRLIFRSLL